MSIENVDNFENGCKYLKSVRTKADPNGVLDICLKNDDLCRGYGQLTERKIMLQCPDYIHPVVSRYSLLLDKIFKI